MARKKKDLKFHVLDGTARGEGKLKSLPAPASDRPRSPKWLGEYAMEFHRANWPVVDSMGTYTVADKDAWFVGCQRYHRIRECEAAIDADGLSVKGRGGEIKRHPCAPILKSELDLFRRFCESFGLEPSARAKMGLKLEKPSKMASFID
jgi:P27 family predicted phage terminase small subunit